MKRFDQSRTFCVILALTLILVACTTTSPGETVETPETDLEATIRVPATLPNGEALNLTFTLTNNTDTRLYVLKWYTPLEGIAGEIFRVERDGQAVPYQGILATRVAPSAEAYVLLEPGESASAEVDLATAYDFSQAGEYTIEFISPRISHVARSETEMVTSLDELGPVQMPSNEVTVEVGDSAGSSDRKTSDEAEKMIRDYLCSQKPNLNPDIYLSVKEAPVQEAWDHLRVQVFKVTEGAASLPSEIEGALARETFLISGETVLRLGTAFGGAGVTSIQVSDLDQDGNAELLFTYSFGSGIHQSRIGMYAPAYAETQIYEAETAYLGDVGLVKEDRSNVAVKVVEPDDETLTLRYLDMLGHLAIQQQEDQVRLVLQAAENLPEELRKNLIRTSEPTPTPFSPDLSDLAPPADGWVAFETPEEQLALISSDGSRHIPVINKGEVRSFAWSPDGRSLAFVWSGQLTLLSIEDARFIPLTPPDTIRSTELTWSQDSRYLAYLHGLDKGSRPVAPDVLRVLDLAVREAITISTYANNRPEEMAVLCPQPCPFPLLAVKEAGFSRIARVWDVRDREVLTELHPASFFCDYLWLPGMPGALFAREETGKAGVEWACPESTQFCSKGETKVTHPTSVVVWRPGQDPAGGEAPTVVLEGTQKRHYHPTRWLPDGRLEVQVSHFEKTIYEGRAQPERVTYRYLTVTEDGVLQEAEGEDLPWWAAGGFEERFEATDPYQEQNRERAVMPGWEVGPDGEMVAFAWPQQVDAEEWESAVYLWRGVEEPRRLTSGSYPQWQPQMRLPAEDR